MALKIQFIYLILSIVVLPYLLVVGLDTRGGLYAKVEGRIVICAAFPCAGT